jgi:hypothetical protein
MSRNGITDIVLVTHSGGSNQARYIMNNYTRNSNYTTVKNATKRVITVAGTTKGTYLANEVFSGGAVGTIMGDVAGLVGYGGEGVNLLRTNYISTYNSSSSYLGPIQNPVNGVNFYGTGGAATTIGCVGVKVWGVCIGISNVRSLDGAATPLSACDSVLDDTGLLLAHDLFLDANDSSTARSSPNASDGFINLLSSQALGNNFGFSAGQDHNESRRQCNGLDAQIRAYVNSSESGFALNSDFSANVNPHQIDACGFGVYAAVKNSQGSTVAWTEGCQKSQLGNGNCDWDCVALYGNDAVVTQWDSTGTMPLQWGTSDCTGTAGGYSGAASGTEPFIENGTFTNTNGGTTYNTQFNGATCTGTSAQCGNYATTTQWFEDPNYDSMAPSTWNGTPCTSSSQCPGMLSCSNGWCTACTNNVNNAAGSCNSSTYGWTGGVCNTSNGVCNYAAAGSPSTGTPSIYNAGYCPQSWIGDGTCDECVVALYGSDGNDCLPGHIVQCGGIVTAAQPYSGSSYYYYNNGVFNEGTPSNGGATWLEWQSMPAVASDGVCENTECAQGTAAALPPAGAPAADNTGLVPCTSGSQCPGMLNCGSQLAGYCDKCTNGSNNANYSCNSSTYGWSGNTCNTSTGVCFQTATLTSACNGNSDCLHGTCVNGACTTSSADCTTSYAVPASTYACGSNSDCLNYGGTCSGGYCTGTITVSLCK